tara:strand:+ start:195 stop:464 length:270 start_codon:yes stop_codon:yes gene_type:complete
MDIINKYASHKWIRKVINSCTNDVQLNNCENLIRNFERVYDDSWLVKDLHMNVTSKMMFNFLNVPNPLFQIDIMKGHYTNRLDYIHETE